MIETARGWVSNSQMDRKKKEKEEEEDTVNNSTLDDHKIEMKKRVK